MQIPPSDHVVWKLARLLILGVLFLAGASLAYNNGLSKADLLPLLSLLAGVGGFDAIKSAITKSDEAK